MKRAHTGMILRRTGGFSLVELMVALAAGLFLVAVLVALVVAASRTDRSLRQTGDLVESARFGLFTLADDVRHAGYYGTYSATGAAPAVMPDPCSLNPDDIRQALPIAIQGYNGGAAPPVACIAAADYVPNTDVVVIRRARTARVESAADMLTGGIYLQSNALDLDVQMGKSTNFDIAQHNAKAEPTVLFRKKILPADPSPAELRLLEVRIYFISPCSNDVCDGGGDGIPTLKRLELTAVGGNPAFLAVPVAAGVERMHVDFGVDALPDLINAETGVRGDGVPEQFFRSSGVGTPKNWAEVVAARVYLVVRELEQTPGYVDDKTYDIGEAGSYKPAGAFRRHAFQSAVWIVNRGGRREV